MPRKPNPKSPKPEIPDPRNIGYRGLQNPSKPNQVFEFWAPAQPDPRNAHPYMYPYLHGTFEAATGTCHELAWQYAWPNRFNKKTPKIMQFQNL